MTQKLRLEKDAKYFCASTQMIHMLTQKHTDLSKFFLVGISYKKADATVRGHYAVSRDHYLQLFAEAKNYNIKEFFVLSTCNRTEIYGFADSADTLARFCCQHCEATTASFLEMAYIRNGVKAVEHLFEVAAGLDSQILGDYEIIGQIKTAVKISKENGFINAYLERMINGVLQASKEIKTSTGLSGGTVSVSFAAIQCIRNYAEKVSNKNFLLIGTGKIGRSTSKNLVDYLGAKNITLMNRTEQKAAELATELGIRFASTENIREEVRKADIILTATNSEQPVILSSFLENSGEKLIIDLSVPYNVEPSAAAIDGITLVNVDGLSKLKDETLHKREEEIPAALAIIRKHVNEFLEWHDMRRHVPVLKEVKSKLEQLNSSELFRSYTSTATVPGKNKEKIQRAVNGMAVKMRVRDLRGCYYIEAMNEFIAAGVK